MKRFIALMGCAATLALPGLAQAQAVAAPPMALFDGSSGYQEIALAPDAWYVAFHGSRDHGMSVVSAGWLARAAQLCAAVGKSHVVQLKYVGEPVYRGERVAVGGGGQAGSARKVAGFVYVPIYTAPQPAVPIITPSMMAPMRCVHETTGLREGTVATAVDEALSAARHQGFALP